MSKFQIYLHVWQLPLAALFIAGWILGGGWLLRAAARKSTSAKLRRITLIRCCQLSFLSGVVGMGGAAAVLCICVGLSKITQMPLMRAGALVASVLGIVLAWLMFYASLPLTGRQSLALAVRPIGATVALAALLGACAYFPARWALPKQFHYRRTLLNLVDIQRALNAYHRRYGVMPARLRQLVDAELTTPDVLAAPVNPHLEVGYFYVSPGPKQAHPPPTQLVAVSLFNEKYPDGRALLFMNGRVRWFHIVDAELFLADDVNAAFAAKLRQIEADLPPPPQQ